ncbi:MAG: hypothetical protein ACKOYC_03845, partial [Bacteroidota bacterium]
MWAFNPTDSSNKSITQNFSSSVSVQSDDAASYFRGLDISCKYEWKRKGPRGGQQLELSDDFGVSIFHGGFWVVRNDRFVARFNTQRNRKKLTLSASAFLEGPLFSKRDVIAGPNNTIRYSASRGGLMDPGQLLVSGGLRWNIRSDMFVEIGAPAMVSKRVAVGGFFNNELEREWLKGSRRHLRYSLGLNMVWSARLPLVKSIVLENRSLLFLNGYQLRYQQWSNEMRLSWAVHKHLEF